MSLGHDSAVGGDVSKPLPPDASLAQMIETILEREDADLSTAKMLRAIAA
jgi:hypothetical protein